MSDTTSVPASAAPAAAGLRLRPGDRLGAQFVRQFVCTDALGERHETVFGSTTHPLDVCVPPAGAPSPTAADYAAFVERVSRVRHPCVVRYFATGENAPRDGAEPVPWLRCEHQEGAPASVLSTAVDPSGLPADDDGRPRVPTFADLFASCGGRLSPQDRDALLGDVLDGLAHLHSLGLPCGHLAPEEIALGHVRHRAFPRARIRVYAWPPDGGPSDLSADLVLAAPLFRAALDASAAVSKPRETEALAAFAERLGAGGFENAAEARAAFDALRAKWGRPRVADPEEEDDGADEPASASGARSPGTARRPPRRRDPVSAGSSEVARRLMSLVRIFLVVAFIVAVGIAVYFFLSAQAEKERRRVTALSGESKPAVLVIPTSRAAEDLFAELPQSVFDFTPAQLALVAGAADDPRAPLAAARAALEELDEAGPSVSAEAFKAASAAVAAVLPALRASAKSDPSAELLLGRAMLIGLGTPVDAAGGYGHVLQASLDGLHEADLVFGDVLASGVKVPDLRAESRTERDRRAVAAWHRAAGTDANPSPQLWRALDRIAPMLRAGRGIPPMKQEYLKWIERVAKRGHVPSLVLLSTPGGFASDNPAEALNFLRILARAQGADPARRAWAQFRMARMFERGEGTSEPEPNAALLWYRRAAELGSREAMEALHRLLRGGTPEERAEAARWREKAKSASPAPGLPLVSSLVEPPVFAAAAAKAPPKTAATSVPATSQAAPAPKRGGVANRAATLPTPRRQAVKTPPPAPDQPLIPLTVETEDEPSPAPKKQLPKRPAPGKKVAPGHKRHHGQKAAPAPQAVPSAKAAAPAPKAAVPAPKTVSAPKAVPAPKAEPGKKAAWPPKGARVDPVRKKDSAK